MIKDGCLEGIQEIYGLHNTNFCGEGQVALKSGALMSAIAGVKITVKGKGVHSSIPHLGNDVISAGAAIIQSLHLIQSRHVPSHENFVLSMTKFNGGACNNVFSDEATVEGCIRCFSNEVYHKAIAKIRDVAQSSASMLGCTADVEFNDYYPAVVNHPKQTEDVRQFIRSRFGSENLLEMPDPSGASEDFSFFLLERPGCFFFLGNGRPEKHLHTSKYDYNDDLIATGGYLWLHFAISKLS